MGKGQGVICKNPKLWQSIDLFLIAHLSGNEA